MIQTRAFTLAEVLMALALLGVVAAFAIPKVMQSTQQNQKIAIFKETLSTLSEVTYNGTIKNELQPTTVSNYYFSNINNVKTCTDSENQGCSGIATAPTSEQHEPGLILHNGASVFGLSDCCQDNTIGWLGWINGIVLDWNGAKGPNTIGDDQLFMVICFGNARTQCSNIGNGQIVKNGTLAPDDFRGAANAALYNTIVK